MKLTKELIDKIVPEIDPEHPHPIDAEKHHCEHSLMLDRQRIREELFALLEGDNNGE